MKKYIARIMISIVIIASFCITTYANEVIKIGGVNENFVEILNVDNGVTYLPIRLAFTNLNNDKYIIRMEPFMSTKLLRLSMVKMGADGKVADGFGRCVEVVWNDDEKKIFGGKGKINAYVYSKENGINKAETVFGTELESVYKEFGFESVKNNELYYGVKTQSVQGGERVFLSLEDLNRIIKFLTNNTNYEVELK